MAICQLKIVEAWRAMREQGKIKIERISIASFSGKKLQSTLKKVAHSVILINYSQQYLSSTWCIEMTRWEIHKPISLPPTILNDRKKGCFLVAEQYRTSPFELQLAEGLRASQQLLHSNFIHFQSAILYGEAKYTRNIVIDLLNTKSRSREVKRNFKRLAMLGMLPALVDILIDIDPFDGVKAI